MLAEVVIHLGSEWRDVGIFLLGCVMGTVVGIAFIDDKYQKQIREQQKK
jgi:hypothetical protein